MISCQQPLSAEKRRRGEAYDSSPSSTGLEDSLRPISEHAGANPAFQQPDTTALICNTPHFDMQAERNAAQAIFLVPMSTQSGSCEWPANKPEAP
ncbi:MAG: hypothetical protein ACKPKO_36390, partial [Candidatus Fonsibacter sp.]